MSKGDLVFMVVEYSRHISDGRSLACRVWLGSEVRLREKAAEGQLGCSTEMATFTRVHLFVSMQSIDNLAHRFRARFLVRWKEASRVALVVGAGRVVLVGRSIGGEDCFEVLDAALSAAESACICFGVAGTSSSSCAA